MTQSKKLGVIVSVDGTISSVGMYQMSNDPDMIWNGNILTGPKIGAFLTIHQNNERIIASVVTEKVIDQQNTIKSVEFDNRFSKNSINRIVQLKTRGVITDKKFEVTSSLVPMIGNEVTLTTQEELEIIYNVENSESVVSIGASILENQPIKLSINPFFASHIGIFGNTGSGKSNTVHKLYLELFRSKYREQILKRSQFFVIDFNGEYSGETMFDVYSDDKKIFNINTRGTETDKVPVTKEYLFDSGILSILFDAKPGTQVPFLASSIPLFNEKIEDKHFDFGKFVVGTLKKILTTGNAANQDSLQDWLDTAKRYIGNDSQFSELDQIQYNSSWQNFVIYSKSGNIFFNTGAAGGVDSDIWGRVKVTEISKNLSKYWNKIINPIQQLKVFLDFQKVHRTAWGKTNREHLNPLFNRMTASLSSLEKTIQIKDDISKEYKSVNIFNLIHANREITRLIPMLISKMFYDEQKKSVSDDIVRQTKHLIIDEAHNILNSEHKNIGDDWQDYRMSIFEEIIKEGRKFGFYLTLSSQRPADISPTILSQVHNYLIHRLVNEKDLRMLENTMPTLDKSSFQMIPSLGKGEVIITGTAMRVPVFVKINKEQTNRPKSDDILLTEIWEMLDN